MYNPVTNTGKDRNVCKYVVKVFYKRMVYSKKLDKIVKRWAKCNTLMFAHKSVAFGYLRTVSRLVTRNGNCNVFKWVLSINTKGGAKRV